MTGGAVTYSSQKQGSVTRSTTELEYMAIRHTLKEQIWLLRLKEIGHDISNQNIIYTDNRSAIALAHNPKHYARTKHIDIQYLRQELRRRWKDPFGVLSSGGYGGRWIDKSFGTGEAQKAGKNDVDGLMEGS